MDDGDPSTALPHRWVEGRHEQLAAVARVVWPLPPAALGLTAHPGCRGRGCSPAPAAPQSRLRPETSGGQGWTAGVRWPAVTPGSVAVTPNSAPAYGVMWPFNNTQRLCKTAGQCARNGPRRVPQRWSRGPLRSRSRFERAIAARSLDFSRRGNGPAVCPHRCSKCRNISALRGFRRSRSRKNGRPDPRRGPPGSKPRPEHPQNGKRPLRGLIIASLIMTAPIGRRGRSASPTCTRAQHTRRAPVH